MATDELGNTTSPSVNPTGGPIRSPDVAPAEPIAEPVLSTSPSMASTAIPSEESIEQVTREMTDELQEILASTDTVKTPQESASVNVLDTVTDPTLQPTQAARVAPPVLPAQNMPAAPSPIEMAPPIAQAPIIPTVADVPVVPSIASASTVLPPVPVQSSQQEDSAHHQVMGQILGHAIEAGKHEVPSTPGPLVCRPRQLESWRVFKIMSEFVEGFELIGKYGLAATFFGTARMGFESRYYAEATDLAGRLAKAGYAIITGGSAGIMEAANKGAYDAGGASVGLNIDLDDNQGLNKYLTESTTFHHFFARKVMLAYSSDVYLFFPGGFGTLDEFTEIITLVQTKKIKRIPIVLYGTEYWSPLVDFFTNKLDTEYHAIDHSDLELFVLVDSVDDAFTYIQKNVAAC